MLIIAGHLISEPTDRDALATDGATAVSAARILAADVKRYVVASVEDP